MNPTKIAGGMIEGFLKEAKPFLDLLKIEGYFTEDMELTDKGKKVLEEYWAKELPPINPFGISRVKLSSPSQIDAAIAKELK
jgi:hypothetical protein